MVGVTEGIFDGVKVGEVVPEVGVGEAVPVVGVGKKVGEKTGALLTVGWLLV